MRTPSLKRCAGLIGLLTGAVVCAGCVATVPQPDGSPSRAPQPAALPQRIAPDALAPTHGPRLADVSGEPWVRVRVARAAQVITISADPSVVFRAAGAAPLRLAGPVEVVRSGGVWRLTDARGAALQFRGQRLDVDPSARGETLLDAAPYPGRLTLLSPTDAADGIDVVNTVDMETYLPGVLQRELFPNWEPAAFEAQAVAARSYALWEIARSRSQGKQFDLESTTASQAYVGVATNPRARQGVAATRGLVLEWQGRVLPAFYASSHGPFGADAATTFVDRVADLPPLRGQVHGTRDALSPRFNWQASRETHELAERIASWGRANRHAVAGVVPPIRDVRLSGRNAAGRHVAYVVTDGRGRSFSLRADQLRHAANRAAAGHPEPDRANLLFSGQFVPTVRGRRVLFLQGHGHGHGVGLSQYGAQAMALRGYRYADILATYYPNAKLARAY